MRRRRCWCWVGCLPWRRLVVLLHAHTPSGNVDLASLLSEHPGDYAMSMGHFLDLNAEALGLFRLPLIIAAVSLVGGPLVSLLLRKRARPVQANVAMAAGAFGFLLAAHMGLVTFAPVISSAQLAEKIRSASEAAGYGGDSWGV